MRKKRRKKRIGNGKEEIFILETQVGRSQVAIVVNSNILRMEETIIFKKKKKKKKKGRIRHKTKKRKYNTIKKKETTNS